jgi:hypothetical protein
MTSKEIQDALEELAGELAAQQVQGEICLYGGAAMCLAFKARPATRDVDAVFEPTRSIRQAAHRIAERHGWDDSWLNDAVKGFVVEHPRRVLLDLGSLKVTVPETEYLLAMKCLAARVDATDRADVRFLIRHLGLKSPGDVFAILEEYYPHGRIKPATRFFIEEILGEC